jgi:hypothetical protein
MREQGRACAFTRIRTCSARGRSESPASDGLSRCCKIQVYTWPKGAREIQKDDQPRPPRRSDTLPIRRSRRASRGGMLCWEAPCSAPCSMRPRWPWARVPILAGLEPGTPGVNGIWVASTSPWALTGTQRLEIRKPPVEPIGPRVVRQLEPCAQAVLSAS